MPITKYLKGECQSCGGHLEFPAEAVGASIDCPHCGKTTELLLATPHHDPTVPLSTIIWTAVTVLLLLGGLGGALSALKRAQKQAAKHRQATEANAAATQAA